MNHLRRICRTRFGAALFAPLLAALTGCAISTPVYMAQPAKGEKPDDRLQVSVTHALIRPQHRDVFDRYVNQISAQLPQQAGLVSYSIRKELLGDQVWTLTVWRSDEDRSRFFGSGLHLAAMSEASLALEHVRSARLEIPRAELPINWERALAVLGPPSWTTTAR